MNVSLTLERSNFADVSIMVDLLRASTTITIALESFKHVIPTRSIVDAQDLALKYDSVLAGERNGAKIDSFDVGNSPIEISSMKGKNLILTTSNGTRILEDMKGQVLIGSFLNANKVAEKALDLAEENIEIVMAGVNGKFVIEDFLGAGEIISYLKEYDLDEMAQASCLAVQDREKTDNAIIKSRSAHNLQRLGYQNDVKFCLKRNISKLVPVYHKGIITAQK
jgi:2-phosphosulfolactate phosphatase